MLKVRAGVCGVSSDTPSSSLPTDGSGSSRGMPAISEPVGTGG